MYCRNCGKELANNSNFCPNCGTNQKESFSGNNIRVPKFINEHKKLSYVYVLWFLVHLTLFISSSKENSEGFYPWKKPLNNMLSDSYYWKYFSFFDKYNVYDFSEFFLYTVLLPIIIYGIYKYWPNFASFIRKNIKIIRQKYSNRQSLEAEKNDYKIKETLSESYATMNNGDSTIRPNTTQDVFENVVQTAQTEDNTEEEEHKDETIEVEPMPLFRRFFGSLIDKVLLVLVFVIGFIITNPFGGAAILGTYTALLKIVPSNYEYIDEVRMKDYRNAKTNPNVSDFFQKRARQANKPPRIGSTKELDKNITLSFVFLNLFYYILFESVLFASLGKRWLGGVLLDRKQKKIGFARVLIRALWSTVFMLIAVFFFHFQMNQTYFVVIPLFFFILDIPVFFTKRSLLDLCTGTIYVKRKSLRL